LNKKVIMGFLAGVTVVILALFFIGSTDEPVGKPAAKASANQTQPANKPAAQTAANPAPQAAAPIPAKPAPQAAVKDPRRYLTVEDVKNITGRVFTRTYVDMKYSGKPDLEFSTTDEGHVALTVTVLRGNYYEKFYNDFRSQDYKPMENAFWGPKNENPPRMLGFRKGDTTIVIMRYVDAGEYYVTVEMMEKVARTISARL
jgi:hypothetical protein